MSEQRYGGESIGWAHLESPEFRQAMRDTGVTAAEAGERLRSAMTSVDWTLFDALYAARFAKPSRRWLLARLTRNR